jgi:hypothetical protein
MESAFNPSPASHARPDHVNVDLAVVLLHDVKQIVRYGPAVLPDPEAVPHLAELALAPAADPSTCATAVVALLHRAFTRLARFDDKFSGREVANAITELMGIGRKEWANQGDRFDNAASELWAYTSGESFRRTMRKNQDGKKCNVWVIFLELLVSALLALADEMGYSPSHRFSFNEIPPYKRERIIAPIERTLFRELRVLVRRGFDGLDDRLYRMPLLVDLATHSYPSGGVVTEKVEALLSWAINRRLRRNDLRDELENRRREAIIIELIGLGKRRDSSAWKRRQQGLRYHRPRRDFGEADCNWREEVDALAHELSTPLLHLALEEAVTRR